MNEKIMEHIYACSKELVDVIMQKIEKDFEQWPEDPFLKGECAKMILQVSTLYIIGGMRHPDSAFRNLVKEYCQELWEIAKDGDYNYVE